MGRKNSKKMKQRLYLKCGRVDFYDMKNYGNLTLHHYPNYRLTKRTIYEESFLVSEKNHKYLHELEEKNYKEYQEVMEMMKINKELLQYIKVKKKMR